MNNLLDQLRQGNDPKKIVSTLAGELYQIQRRADYPQEPEYADAWNLATQDQGLPTRTENDWVYRGTFPAKDKGEKTETRGSLNIKLSPAAVKELDELITSGVIKGNYKFGDPGTGAAGTDRHDAVTVYFLEKPDQNALDALSDIARRHYRGENLLGNKISDGFYISEVGSIPDRQAGEFLAQLAQTNPQLASGMRQFLTNRDGRIAMSEAQFYMAKETLDLYNIDLGYNQEQGISIRLRK